MNRNDSNDQTRSGANETTLDVLAFIESFAATVGGSSVRASYKAIAKRAREFANERGLQEDERDALYGALLAIVDATIKAKKRGKRTAALASEAFAKRVRLVAAAAIFAGMSIVALWLGIADFLFGLFHKSS